MADATRFQFTNPSVPKAYDAFFVPRLFEPWAKLLLDEVDLRPGESVLDVATGPGTVARLAAMRLGARGRVVATDIAQPMLTLPKPRLSHRPRLLSNTCSLPPRRWRFRRKHSTPFSVSRASSSSRIELLRCERCDGS
jgi:SAM-dependent methyltransferase